MKNQLSRGCKRRVMYIENKCGKIDGSDARIGWVTFSKSGKSIYYKDKIFMKLTGGIAGNYFDENGDEYWISGVKKRGCNSHWAEKVSIEVDEDAVEEYKNIKKS